MTFGGYSSSFPKGTSVVAKNHAREKVALAVHVLWFCDKLAHPSHPRMWEPRWKRVTSLFRQLTQPNPCPPFKHNNKLKTQSPPPPRVWHRGVSSMPAGLQSDNLVSQTLNLYIIMHKWIDNSISKQSPCVHRRANAQRYLFWMFCLIIYKNKTKNTHTHTHVFIDFMDAFN